MAEDLRRRWVLGLALAFTSLGIVRVGMVPVDAPQPRPLDPALLQQFRQRGWQVHSSVAAQGRTQVSNSAGVVLIPPESARSDNVQLRLIPIRARSADQLGAESLGAAISNESPQNGRTLTIQGDQFYRFGDRQQQQLASSCIASGQASSNEDRVSLAIGAPPTSWFARIQTTVGLQPLRDWSCLFTTISVADADQADADQAIRRVWAEVRPTLTKRTGSVGIR